jgi:hypothetical protein
LTPSKSAAAEAAVLEEFPAAAGTKISPAEFFVQFFVAVDDAAAAFHFRLRRIAPAAFAERFKMRLVERSVDRQSHRVGSRPFAWDTKPFEKENILKPDTRRRHAKTARVRRSKI